MSEPTSPAAARAAARQQADLGGLTGLQREQLVRVPIRTRELARTLSAWQLHARCDQGRGTVTLLELSTGATAYRGDGAFLGLTQDQLKNCWTTLRPPPEAADESLQLG